MYSQNDYRYYSELYHYGIQGQKWGVRRYQNEDGSLTAAGKERYGSGQKYTNPDGTLSEKGREKRQRLVKGKEIASKTGAVVGGLAGGSVGLAAGAAVNLALASATGVILPLLPITLAAASAYNGAAIVSNILDKYGDKKINQFDRMYGG